MADRAEDGGRDSDTDLVLRAHRDAGPGCVRVLARGKASTGAGTRIRHGGKGKNAFELYALTLR